MVFLLLLVVRVPAVASIAPLHCSKGLGGLVLLPLLSNELFQRLIHTVHVSDEYRAGAGVGASGPPGQGGEHREYLSNLVVGGLVGLQGSSLSRG